MYDMSLSLFQVAVRYQHKSSPPSKDNATGQRTAAQRPLRKHVATRAVLESFPIKLRRTLNKNSTTLPLHKVEKKCSEAVFFRCLQGAKFDSSQKKQRQTKLQTNSSVITKYLMAISILSCRGSRTSPLQTILGHGQEISTNSRKYPGNIWKFNTIREKSMKFTSQFHDFPRILPEAFSQTK